MDLNLSPAEEAFRHDVRNWFAHNLPQEWHVSRLHGLPEDEFAGICRKWQVKLGEAGWLGLAWPKEYGGRGATLIEQAVFMTETYKAHAPQPLDWVGLRLFAPALMELGTPELRARFLPPILRGEQVWCQGFSETNAGSDLASLQTRATAHGDHFVVNGHKVWSTDAQYADWCLVMARTNPEAVKHKGITMFAVDMKTPGVSVRPIKQIGGSSEFNEIFFDEVRIPRENIIGGLDNGWHVAMRALTYERGLYTLLVESDYRTTWDEMRQYAHATRRNGQSLAAQDTIREQLAQTFVDIEMLRLTNLRYISRYQRGIPAGDESSLMKLHWALAEQRLYDLTMTLGAPFSLIMPTSPRALSGGDWNSWYFASRSVTIYGGTQDIQRNLIAERIYGLPR